MSTLAIDKAGPTRKLKYGSMSRDRTWALRWSYFFLTLFAIFALVPPIYMLITSLKSSAEISAATNPWASTFMGESTRCVFTTGR